MNSTAQLLDTIAVLDFGLIIKQTMIDLLQVKGESMLGRIWINPLGCD